MELFKVLSKIQKELKAPKNQRNNFGNYNYRSCEDILEAVKPLLENCILTLSDEIVVLGNTVSTPYQKTEFDKIKKQFFTANCITGGDRFYIKATATIRDEKDFLSVNAYAREDEDKAGMAQAQITGSASSYARKYALNGLFLIDDTKDSDSTDNQPKPTTMPSDQAKNLLWVKLKNDLKITSAEGQEQMMINHIECKSGVRINALTELTNEKSKVILELWK